MFTLVVALVLIIPTKARAAIHPVVKKNLLCIKRHEAGWQQGSYYTRNGRPVYAGGLQGDDSFLRTYNRPAWKRHGKPRYKWVRIHGHYVWFWVNSWSIDEQLAAGAAAVRVRGYSPWPLTRVPCGV